MVGEGAMTWEGRSLPWRCDLLVGAVIRGDVDCGLLLGRYPNSGAMVRDIAGNRVLSVGVVGGNNASQADSHDVMGKADVGVRAVRVARKGAGSSSFGAGSYNGLEVTSGDV